jgi:hypothetical protein
MKKVLVVFLSAVMVLSLTAVAFGAVNVGGELKVKYNFQGAASENGATTEGADNNDKFEGKMILNGNMNDNLSYKIVAKATATDNDSSKSGDDGKNSDFYLDEYWGNYDASFGSIKVGLFSFKPKGPIVDVIDAAYKDLKAATAIQYSNKFADAIDLAVFYVPDYYKKDEALYDNAVAVKVGYNTDMWGVEGNVVSVGNAPDSGGKAAADGRATGYTVNAYVVPIENFTVYASIGQDQFEDPCQILGLKYVYDKFTAMLEYDLDKDNGDYGYGGTGTEYESNLWGAKLIYKSAHGVEYEFGKKLTETAKGGEQTSECWVSAKIAF